MTFKKGEIKPNQGKRGPGLIQENLRKMILGALDDAGGQKYLKEQAQENPNAFMSLVGKCLPKEIKAEIAATHVISNLTPEQQRGIAEAILLGK